MLDIKPLYSYTKVFNDYKDATSEMKFYLGIGLFFFDIIAYVEVDGKMEFLSSDLNFLDINYSESSPLIVFSVIIFAILCLSILLSEIFKKVFMKQNQVSDGEYKQIPTK